MRAILDVRLPAPHRLWLVPGMAIAVLANAQAAGPDLGLATVLVFGIVPHLPVLLGVRRPLPPGPMALFNAMHEPFVPLAFLAVAIIVAAPSLAFVAALAWLSHIVVDWALGDGLRVPGASTRRRSFLEGRLGRSVRAAATPSPLTHHLDDPHDPHDPRKETSVDPLRRTALVAGLLYLATFIIGIPPAMLLDPVLTDPGYITSAGSDLQVLLASSFDVINALACIGTAVVLFPIVKRQHEGMALGFLTTRLVEAAVILVGVVSILAVVTLRQPGATGAEETALVTVGRGLVAVRDWTFLLGPGLMPALNALLLGTLLYRSGLVPRWMPTIGLIGAPMLICSTVGIFFGINEVLSPWTAIATVPIFVWELSIGLWLSFKGFRSDATLLAASTTPAVTPVVAKAGAW